MIVGVHSAARAAMPRNVESDRIRRGAKPSACNACALVSPPSGVYSHLSREASGLIPPQAGHPATNSSHHAQLPIGGGSKKCVGGQYAASKNPCGVRSHCRRLWRERRQFKRSRWAGEPTMRTYIVFSAIAVALLSCGGGDDKSTTGQSTPPPQGQHQLTVIVQGKGRVTSAPSRIDCDSTGVSQGFSTCGGDFADR